MPADSPTEENEFARMLDAMDSAPSLRVGELMHGIVLSVEDDGLIVDLGQKRDGFVPRADVDRLNPNESRFKRGDEIDVILVSLAGRDGNLEASVFQARQNQDWIAADALLQSGELWVGTVVGYNRGGVILPFGELRGFVPASHIVDLPQGIAEADRQRQLARLVGQEIGLKVIEVSRKRRRLVFSQREARREWRDYQKARLLERLEEGQVLTGTISGLREFGAFVDLGGADGLVHVSELAWRRVQHPREVVRVGEQVEVMVIKVDRERKRIGLSMKRLQPDPWEQVNERFSVDQTVTGCVTRVAQFGAFVDLGDGLEGLLHKSEIPPAAEALASQAEQELTLRVIDVDAHRQRIGLSLYDVVGSPPIEAPAEVAGAAASPADAAIVADEQWIAGEQEDESSALGKKGGESYADQSNTSPE